MIIAIGLSVRDVRILRAINAPPTLDYAGNKSAGFNLCSTFFTRSANVGVGASASTV
jgi:hypothetical protein